MINRNNFLITNLQDKAFTSITKEYRALNLFYEIWVDSKYDRDITIIAELDNNQFYFDVNTKGKISEIK